MAPKSNASSETRKSTSLEGVETPATTPEHGSPTDSKPLSLDALERAEEAAQAENEAAAQQKEVKVDRRRGRRRPEETKAEREAKIRELDKLLKQSAAFSEFLTKKTEVLGRVGSSLDGKTLGEHDLKMATQPKCMVNGTMHDYQLEGLTWMKEICLQGMSGILADEMGLGKTVQTISLVAHVREAENYYGPHLIVGPLSTLSNWMDEFQKWTPSIPVVLFHGLPKERQEIYDQQLKPNLKGGTPNAKFPVVITSYEMVLRDSHILGKIPWEFIMVDEGHRLKNADAKLFNALRQFQSATRMLITGTPLQNNLKELWSLLHFLLPNIFTNWDAFQGWFDFSELENEEGTRNFIGDSEKQDLVQKMHSILQPLLLRRIKADVAKHLPKKREYVLFAPMTKEQTDLYNVLTNTSVDTREWLENKIVTKINETFDASTNKSRTSSVVSKARANKKGSNRDAKQEISLAVRGKEQQDIEDVEGSNAFSMMMKRGRGRPKKQPDSGATSRSSTPATTRGKRKGPPAASTPDAKSARTSRDATPASTRGRRSARKTYVEAGDDEDKLSDDEFEAKLADELAEKSDDDEIKQELSGDELERAQTLELAKKAISKKKLLNTMMQLRQACNSPHNFYNPWDVSENIPVDETIVTASGKMLMLDRLLKHLFDNGHKVLIFSQFQKQLDILQDYCQDLRGWITCRIDGGVSQDDRRAQIKNFNTDPDYKVFLLSTRAGGLGINLASADTVILFDSDFNPQLDLQAQDRAHRIGQKRPVIVYRLATKGTVEEQLLNSADAKRRLEKLVIKKGGFKSMGQKMDQTEGGLDAETLQALLLKDGEVYNTSGGDEILSEKDLEALSDRSDEAYSKAASGDGDADGYRVVETGAESITMAKRS